MEKPNQFSISSASQEREEEEERLWSWHQPIAKNSSRQYGLPAPHTCLWDLVLSDLPRSILAHKCQPNAYVPVFPTAWASSCKICCQISCFS
jgi:hypothetical protein